MGLASVREVDMRKLCTALSHISTDAVAKKHKSFGLAATFAAVKGSQRDVIRFANELGGGKAPAALTSLSGLNIITICFWRALFIVRLACQGQRGLGAGQFS